MSSKPQSPPRPFVAALVLVNTREAIGGAHEHAAVVTSVFPGDVIDALVMPAGETPYPARSIPPFALTAAVCWRWPARI